MILMEKRGEIQENWDSESADLPDLLSEYLLLYEGRLYDWEIKSKLVNLASLEIKCHTTATTTITTSLSWSFHFTFTKQACVEKKMWVPNSIANNRSM